jgi:hypothetical protein
MDNSLQFYKNENPVSIESQFEESIQSKFKIFNNGQYSTDTKRLILLLFNAFGSRKQPLIGILEFEILRNNLMT